MMALCVADRAASCRAAAAVASKRDVVPNGSKSARAPFSFVEVVGEVVTLVERGVEREQRDFVLTLMELRQDRVVRLARHRDLRANLHAAAHVDQNRQAERRLAIGPKRENRPHLSVVADLEIGRW